MTDLATILILEDDEALLAGIADLLEISDIGYELKILTASDGTVGLSILGEHLPDLIISDVMMPKMGGYEFLRHVRKNPSWLHIPIIFLTAKGTDIDIREGRTSGAELYITKPYDSDDLIQLIQSQLERAFQLQVDRERRLQRLRSNIVQVLNHEFRTPLTYVTAYYDLLAEGLMSEDIDLLWEYLHGIQVGAARLRRLINDLITVMELRTGELAARYRRKAIPITDLGENLSYLCNRYRLEHESKGVSIHCKISESLPSVFGQRDLLMDACDRLIDNAVKFSVHQSAGAEVRVQALTDNGEIRITVEDNGLGLPDSEYMQIFDLFYQYNRPVLEQQGAGTGLTIARGLIELHNGRIVVASEEGKGSSFTIILPALVYDQFGKALAKDPEQTRKPATVLIVEDELNLLAGLRDFVELMDGDYIPTVLTASGGSDALTILEKQTVNLIISDIMMPGMDGYELLSRVRSNDTWLHIPFIFLTARGERQDILLGLKSGVEEYISKPYDGQELFDLVATQLDRHFERQGLIRQDFEELKRGILNVLLPGLRIPLEAVSQFSHTLVEALSDVHTDGDLFQHLMGIQAGSNQLTRLSEDFMFLAELQTGEAIKAFELRSKPADVTVLLDEFSRDYYRTTDGNNVQFTLDLDPGLPPIMTDRQLLQNCLVRLIDVASSYVPDADIGVARRFSSAEKLKARDIVLGSSRDGINVCLSLSIIDGRITEQEIRNINKLLTSTDLVVLELSEHNPGLTIVKGSVDIHGGRIQMEQIQGNGIRFRIQLPAL
jgi:signal transduction histidine kinase